MTGTLGVALPQNLIVGAQALTYLGSPENRTAWGIGMKAGLLVGGFEFSGAYLPYTRDAQSASTRTGSGYTFNLGYNWSLGSVARLGMYLTYWALHHSKENGSTLTNTSITRFVFPQLALGFTF
jgi:hypothetical protein